MTQKVVAGFFSFTEITDPAERGSYEVWHQLDHMPEQLTLPGIVWGQRWTTSPRCMAVRAVSDPTLDPVEHLTMYLMAGPLKQTLADFNALGRRLREADRFHLHRRAVLSGAFGVVAMRSAPRALVSPQAVPYRPNLGVHVRLEHSTDPRPNGDWLDAMVEVPGVAGAWGFKSITKPRLLLTMSWLDADPVDVSRSIVAKAADRAPDNTPLLDGPFERIEPMV